MTEDAPDPFRGIFHFSSATVTFLTYMVSKNYKRRNYNLCKNTLSFTRNELKYLAAACMLIDHIAAAFVPTLSVAGSWMHFFGRFTGPLMVYFIVEGYIHTQG